MRYWDSARLFVVQTKKMRSHSRNFFFEKTGKSRNSCRLSGRGGGVGA